MSKREQIKRNAVASAKKQGGVKGYFKGIKSEMGKVVWPTRKELYKFTVVVLCTCTIFALAFWIIDSAVLFGLQALIGDVAQ